jgi:hypothetical protein
MVSYIRGEMQAKEFENRILRRIFRSNGKRMGRGEGFTVRNFDKLHYFLSFCISSTFNLPILELFFFFSYSFIFPLCLASLSLLSIFYNCLDIMLFFRCLISIHVFLAKVLFPFHPLPSSSTAFYHNFQIFLFTFLSCNSY